ncbi:TetR/AcrR family transcriptional regulator [Arenivirga flava]|uniref:HTH tetR-type domain-containing protein n=1 Tax=Arenivirga flava TaxID=1930060 RepID=A0AA37UGQ0_9MICO|nr:TetR/AcrR family transcriptional regulator [Arenivirga flava]GMA29155.1 hypothetical protein GCM10025874_24080 [Arenivirga flava]
MDPRIARTRRALQQALLGLVRERELEAVTIADVVERAEVTRSSFYLHYSDKETLLADALDALAEEEGAELPELLELIAEPPQALIAYLRHFDANAEVYRRVLGPHGSAVASDRLHASIEALAASALAQTGTDAFTDVPLDVAAAGLAGSVVGVLRAWIAREPRPSVEEGAGWIWQVLIGPGGAWQSMGAERRDRATSPLD